MSEPNRESSATSTKSRPRNAPRPKLLPPYHVILLNDDDHSFEFVVEVLRQVLGVSTERGIELAHEAHTRGRAVIWTGPLEVAELKAEQVSTFHEIRQRDGAKLGPVGCSIEPAPGA